MSYHIKKFLATNLITKFLWSIFPSACTFPGCEGLMLRWTEMTITTGFKDTNEVVRTKICHECMSTLRKEAFKAGLAQSTEDGYIIFRDPDKMTEKECLEHIEANK